jgi:hypothetical protein
MKKQPQITQMTQIFLMRIMPQAADFTDCQQPRVFSEPQMTRITLIKSVESKEISVIGTDNAQPKSEKSVKSVVDNYMSNYMVIICKK